MTGEETERGETVSRPMASSDTGHLLYKRKISEPSDAWLKHAFG